MVKRTLAGGLVIAAGILVGAWQSLDAARDVQLPATPRFEEASIRPCDPDTVPPAPAGARGGGPNSFQMTPGRTHAQCLTLATLIRTAFGYEPWEVAFLQDEGRGNGFDFALDRVYGLGVEEGLRVRGGPEWIRSERYSIDAIAGDASNAATMAGPMLKTLLEERFQLKAHVETEQVKAYSLAIAPGGLKIKPAPQGSCEPRPRPTPVSHSCGVRSTLTRCVVAQSRPATSSAWRTGRTTSGLAVKCRSPNSAGRWRCVSGACA